MKWFERNSYLVPFFAVFLVSSLVFLLMDMAVMDMQGLSLIFQL